MSSKERGVLERYANWHPTVPSLKSVGKGCGSCEGGGGDGRGGGCIGGTCSSCNQCGGCSDEFHPGLGRGGKMMRRR